MPEETSTRRFDRDTNATLQSRIAIVLCLTIVFSSIALVELNQRIRDSVMSLPSDDNAASERERLARLAYGARRTRPKLVCVLSIDGLRADQVDEEGRFADLTRESLAFHTAAAQSSQSLVSLKSMLTGKYPSSLILEETSADQMMLSSLENPREFLLDAFRSATPTLAAHLNANGYRAGVFADGGLMESEPSLTADFGKVDVDAKDASECLERAAAWLAANSDRDIFLLAHTRALTAADTHATYRTAVDRAETAVVAFVEALRDQGVWDDTLLVLTSNHGTSLGERDEPGSGDLYIEQLLVPVVVKPPAHWKLTPARVDAAIELVDLYPSLGSATGDRMNKDIDGVSFLPILFRGVEGRDYLVAQTSWSGGGANAVRRSVLSPGRWQIIHDANNDVVEFFSLENDPHGLIAAEPTGEEVPAFIESLFHNPAPRSAPAAGFERGDS